MKSLMHSLFDQDLVQRDPFSPYLYGLITYAKVSSEWKVDEIDEHKVRWDFNRLPKEFEPRDWSDNPYTSLAKIQKMQFDETLRELLYIIAANVKTKDVIRKSLEFDVGKLSNQIKKVILDYVDPDVSEITTYHRDKETIVIIKFKVLVDDRELTAAEIYFELPSHV